MKHLASRRFFLAVAILISGALASVFIIGSSAQDVASNAQNAMNVSAPASADVGVSAGATQQNAAPTPGESERSAAGGDSENLTANLANKLVQNIIQKSPAGITRQNLSSLSETIPEDLLAEQFSAPLSVTSFTRDDLSVARDDSEESQLSYLAELQKINREHFGKIALTIPDAVEAWISEQNVKPLEQYARTIPEFVGELLALPAPPSWSAWHLQALNFWERLYAVANAASAMERDPIKSIIAVREAVGVLEDITLLQTMLEKKAEQLES